MKNNIRRIAILILLIIIIYSTYTLFSKSLDYKSNKRTYESLQKHMPSEYKKNNVDESTSNYSLHSQGFNELSNLNDDFVAWITIPSINLSYPIVQGDDNEFYLTHNFNKLRNNGGCLFVDVNNTSPFIDSNTIIYGHNMRDGSMFASLFNFEDMDLSKNNKIYISLKESVLEYEIFSIYSQSAEKDNYKIDFNNDQEYLEYLNAMESNSSYAFSDITFTPEDKIITLSTCSYDVFDGRFIVHGRLIKKTDVAS